MPNITAPTIDILYGDEQHRAGLAESPLWDESQQCWYWIDIDRHQIHRHNNVGAQHMIWQLPADTAYDLGAIALADDGQLMLALRAGIASIDANISTHTPTSPIDITPTIIIPAPYDCASTRFNDGGVDEKGRWWIGSLFAPKTRAGAHLYCLDKGVLTAVLGESAQHTPYTDWGMTTANGFALSPDGKTLYHADTQAHTVYRYDFDIKQPPATALSNRRIFFQTQDTRSIDAPYDGRPDGAAVDSAGNYWLALYEGAHIVQIAPDGTVLQKIPLPAKCPTMLCFGGKDLKTLIITTVGNRSIEEKSPFYSNGYILKIRVNVAGLYSHHYKNIVS